MRKLLAFFRDMKTLIKILLKVLFIFLKKIAYLVIDPENLNINEEKMNRYTLLMKNFVLIYYLLRLLILNY